MENLTPNNYRILLVDDDNDILEFLSYNLKKEGFNVFTALNGNVAIEEVKKNKPHLIILDIMMPEKDGIETCETIRNTDNINNPIIVLLTARGEDYSQIAGFNAGADDYITKPIKPKVLISRIYALLRRINTQTNSIDKNINILKYNNLEINKEKYIVIVNDEELILPRKEFELILLLASKPDNVFTRDEIYDKIWGNSVVVGDRTIDVHIRKLREKIGDNYIKTIKGVGYKFTDSINPHYS